MTSTFSGPVVPAPDRSDKPADKHAPTIAQLRDRAIMGVLRYANASVNTAMALHMEDYYSVGNRRWLRMVENGFERHVLVDAKLEHLIDEYVLGAGIANDLKGPLFRSTISGSGKTGGRCVHRYHVAKLARQIANLKSVRLSEENTEFLLQNIKPSTAANIRDRAIIGMMLYVSATPREIAAFRTSHYLDNGDWCCIKLARSRIIEVPKSLHDLLRQYVRAENPPLSGLFFRVDRSRGMTPSNIENMIRRRINDLSVSAEAAP